MEELLEQIETYKKEIEGFAEAATLSKDEHILYYHKRENNKFVLYCTRMRN